MKASIFEVVSEAPFAAMSSRLSRRQSLALVQAVHTAIYIVMAAATFVLLYAGITGAQGPVVWSAFGLLGAEVVFFAGNGFRCPLTTVAVKYGADSGRVGDTFLPERVTRYTFRFFGSVMGVGLLLLCLRWAGAL